MLVALVSGIGAIASFGLAWLYAGVLYWADRHEKEPWHLLVGMFLWGALVATFGSIVFSLAVDAGAAQIWGGSKAAWQFTSAAVVAPLVEETFKGIALLLLFAVAYREVDSLFDGVIYGALVGLGFEAVENSLYIASTMAHEGLASSFMVGLLRLGLFGYTHAFYTGLTGLGLAVVRLYPRRWWAWPMPFVGWSTAVLAHALHNATMTLGAPLCLIGLVGESLGLVALLGILAWSLRREAQWLRRYLQDEVRAGRISPAHYQTACSWQARRRALQRARRRGKRSWQITRAFYRHLTDLAFALAHLDRGNAASAATQRRVAELRAAITRLAPEAESAPG